MKPTKKEVVIQTPYIQLGQLLKLLGLVDTGGAVKTFLSQHPIQVNHMIEQRRGRKLYPGDEIVIRDHWVVISNKP